MGFPSGTVSFNRFAVVGKGPTNKLEILAKMAEHTLPSYDDADHIPDEVEYGWCGGRHVFDGKFNFEHNVFADAVYVGLRVDTNKVPTEVKKAWQITEEEAVAIGNPSGFISKAQKTDVRESIRQKMEESIRAGKWRRSKVTPVLWDVDRGVVYSPAGGAKFEKLAELFHRTFKLDLQPVTSGSLAARALEAQGRSRDYEDLRPTRFVLGPEGESLFPEYPWTAKGPEPKDFLGNEFMTWLIHEADARTAMITITLGQACGKTEQMIADAAKVIAAAMPKVQTASGEVTVFFDRSIDFACAYGQTGKGSLRGDGPTRMPEARAALRSAKVPRKAGMVLDVNRNQFVLNLNAETLSVATAGLPDVEDADTARTLFEERIQLVRDLAATIDGLFNAFLRVRASSKWEHEANQIRKWICQPAKQSAAA